ncbi:glycoside hydrolase family 2 protein [Chitinophaga ginsengisoli]|uniref:Glycosyl hydrolase family 2 n=1 Tax=Chitinophaga ginsengisoli TaxID=363837 RepID=A0A2P8G9Q3_9BACT|nr:sugar-binding domain-containing protein [Chitinophaga ginsengisoli]PSL30704.1 glycosyl hydrolase family 2 [Chitinophaga ginsengisoli]
MFRKSCLLGILILTLSPFLGIGQDKIAWQMQTTSIQTRWAKDVNPLNPLPEYPRPQMVRDSWTNLNGLWEYAITVKGDSMPLGYEGKILVPYPLESGLSGVQKRITPQQNLWYRKIVTYKKDVSKKTLLHFGAVDNEATVYVNGKEIGRHEGGYTAFFFDITNTLKDGDNEIVVKVFDPTDQGVYPHGKQVSNPANIYYTPTSGIWQTVWLETVPVAYIANLIFTPDIDKGILNITVSAPVGYSVEVTALDNNSKVGNIKGKANISLRLPVKNAKLWAPEDPFLYDLDVKLIKGSKVVDEVSSYFGMRKISVGKDQKGYYRIFLNNKYVYNLGTLDQGFWPDGLYTAPTDEALKFDIEAIKAMGFNTIRKHIKVESARWYYYADKLGMLVWQDFVNPNQGLPEGSKTAFEKQLNETIDQLYNHPSITTWVLFNEKWGQYDQQRLTEYVKQKDPSRLLNAHSGEMLWVNEQLRSPSPNAWIGSYIADVHSYPNPMNAPAKEGRVQILGEFGGIGVFIPDHQWLSNRSWGYVQVTPSQLLGKYAIMNEHLQLLEKEGLAGSIYTQPFDVEGEENGIMTYDREVIKIPFEELRKIHAHLVQNVGIIPQVRIQDADITDPGISYSKALQKYIDGERNPNFLKQISNMARQVEDAVGYRVIAQSYISSLCPPYTDSDFNFMISNLVDTSDLAFQKLIKEVDLTNTTSNVSWNEKLREFIFNSIVRPKIKKNMSRNAWDSVYVEMGIYKTFLEEFFLRERSLYFLRNGNISEFTESTHEWFNKFGKSILNWDLNNYAWAVFENISDQNLLSYALQWSKRTVEEEKVPIFMDTYANILYKLGNRDLAIFWEKKAIESANGEDLKVFQDVLNKFANKR